MGIKTEQYIRKPLFVDAVRVTDENFDEMVNWCQPKGEVMTDPDTNKRYIKIRVSYPKGPRQTKAFVGDWILWNDRGGYKIYTDKAFRESFEPVKESTHPNVATTVSTPPTPIEAVALTEDEAREKLGLPRTVEETPISEDATVQSTPSSPPPVVDGKRVISEEEQRVMTREEIRELISSGEAVLAQDLAA